MEDVLYGCDVMPSAIHITGSTLSGAQPNLGFRQSRLYTMPYGRQEDGSVKIGSLELLQSSSVMTLFNTSDPAMRTGSVGEETAAQVIADIPDESFDLVIMNPPFTRATNHGGVHADVVNPAFAAFGATRDDQGLMGDRIKTLGNGTEYHGNAGMASAFAALANRKLKRGGVLALVLPLVATAGLSWQRFRGMIAQDYENLSVLSIAANNVTDMSFSSDTGLGECLVICSKGRDRERITSSRAKFTSLRHRPRGFVQASAIAQGIAECDSPRGIEDGPYGGTAIMVGDKSAGELLATQPTKGGENWGSVRLLDYTIAQVAYALSLSKLWLPGSAQALSVNMAKLDAVSTLGLVDRDINGPIPRGPFDKTAPNQTASFPSLWNHNAKKESRMICTPDSQLRVRQGMETKANAVWATASRAHLNRDFRFNSQPLAVAFTEYKSLGGRSWPNVKFESSRLDYAFALWGNCTLGMLMYWWHSSRQDSGRGVTTIRSAESLPVLDLRTLTDDQLSTAQEIFDDFRKRDLMPAYLADSDPNRDLLDRRVICDLLGFDQDTYRAVRRLSAKWCAEPSVHGGKKTAGGGGEVGAFPISQQSIAMSGNVPNRVFSRAGVSMLSIGQ